MRGLGESVLCSTCGKTLRGTRRVHGIEVRSHVDPSTGRRCVGTDRLDHKPKKAKR